MTNNNAKNDKPTLLDMIKKALYIGAIGYGGPAIIAQMKKTFTKDHSWFSDKEFMETLSLAQILPGATGVSMMGSFGYKKHRFWGAVLLPLAYIAPAVIAIMLISWAYFKYGDLSFVKPLFVGLGALVVALLLNATSVLNKSVFKEKGIAKNIKGVAIAAIVFSGAYFLNIYTVWLILLSGALGFALFYFTGEFEGEKATKQESVSIKINERFKLDKSQIPLAIVLLVVFVILLIPLTGQIFTTFFNIGLFAFGGGFTTIPLIQHIVVDQLHWLDFAQFRDGIALGQITPGPVFITATFIGYKVMGIIGALVATVAIFMPSLILMVALTNVHDKIKHLKIVQVIIRGFLSGFIGLLAAITLQFAFKSLIGWQAWLIFTAGFTYTWYFKKNAVWAIIGTIVISLIIL